MALAAIASAMPRSRCQLYALQQRCLCFQSRLTFVSRLLCSSHLRSFCVTQLYIGNLAAGQVTEGMLQQVFNSALIAAFPDAGRPGCEPVIKVILGAREWSVWPWLS